MSDFQGIDSGYTTTLQLSGNITDTSGDSIAAANLALIGQPAVTLFGGTSNPNVQPTIATSSPLYPLSAIQTIIYRNDGANSGITGIYGVFLPLNLTMPPAQKSGNYQGTLVLTLIQN